MCFIVQGLSCFVVNSDLGNNQARSGSGKSWIEASWPWNRVKMEARSAACGFVCWPWYLASAISPYIVSVSLSRVAMMMISHTLLVSTAHQASVVLEYFSVYTGIWYNHQQSCPSPAVYESTATFQSSFTLSLPPSLSHRCPQLSQPTPSSASSSRIYSCCSSCFPHHPTANQPQSANTHNTTQP